MGRQARHDRRGQTLEATFKEEKATDLRLTDLSESEIYVDKEGEPKKKASIARRTGAIHVVYSAYFGRLITGAKPSARKRSLRPAQLGPA
jgi:hypothetical protein